MADPGPYESAQFRVKWDGRFIQGVSKVSGLRWSSEVVVHRDGSAPTVEKKMPGRTTYAALTLERGITADTAFSDWAEELVGVETIPAGGFRKNLVLDLYDMEGRLVVSFLVYGCFPSGYEAVSQLDADGNAVAVERLILEYDVSARDKSVVAPATA